MRMPKPGKNHKPTFAISTGAGDRATVKRLLAAMESFMTADSAIDEVALTQRAA